MVKIQEREGGLENVDDRDLVGLLERGGSFKNRGE